MLSMSLNVSQEFIVLNISNILNLCSAVLTWKDYRRSKQKTLFYLSQTWFWFFFQNLVQGLSYLLLDSNLFILYKCLTIPSIYFLIYTSDSLTRYDINPFKMGIFGIYCGGLLSSVFDPTSIELIQFPDGTFTWNSTGWLFYWTVVLIFIQSYMFLHQTIKIYLNVPSTLKIKAFGIMVGGILISIISLVLYILGLNRIFPAITYTTMSIGVILISLIIHNEPKLGETLKIMSKNIETEYYNSLKNKLAETEKKLEERNKQLLQAQKMESMGAMASGMAHDFNNVLQTIRSNTELLFSDSNLNLEQKDMLTDIGEACEIGTNIARQILMHSRKSDETFTSLDINSALNPTIELCKKTFPRNIEFVVNYFTQPLVIKGNRTQLQQLIMNLAINARDVMQKGGKIIITISSIELNSVDCTELPPLKPGLHVQLRFQDTGPGMPSEILNHLFEPFYTTKAEGKGTGLGLFIMYNIVKNHNGFIKCNSEKGKGTEFVIYFPLI